MITQTPADALPHSATELLLSLEHIPSEEKLVEAKRCNYSVVVNRDLLRRYPRIYAIPKSWLPHHIGQGSIVLPDLKTISKEYPADTVTESLEAAVRDYAARERYVFAHEMDDYALEYAVNDAVANESLDLAAAKFKRVLFPELRRRGRDEAEIIKIGQDFVSRVMSNLVWRDKLGIFLDDSVTNYGGARDARFIGVLDTMREAMNCDNRTLLGGSAVNPHRIIAWAAGAGTRIETLVRDAVQMTQEVKPDKTFDRTADSVHGQAYELTEFLSEKFSGRWFCRKLRQGYSAATARELIERVEDRFETLERLGAVQEGEEYGCRAHFERRRKLGLLLNPARKALQQLKPWCELDPQLLADMLNT